MCGTDLAYEDEMCGTHADLVYGGTRRKGVQVQHVAAQGIASILSIVLYIGYMATVSALVLRLFLVT